MLKRRGSGWVDVRWWSQILRALDFKRSPLSLSGYWWKLNREFVLHHIDYSSKNASARLGCNQTCLQLMCSPTLDSKDSCEKFIWYQDSSVFWNKEEVLRCSLQHSERHYCNVGKLSLVEILRQIQGYCCSWAVIGPRNVLVELLRRN